MFRLFFVYDAMATKKSSFAALCIFVLLSLIEVIPLAFGIETLHPFVKPLLIPALAATALLELLPGCRGPLVAWLAAGLFLHTAGDVLLLFDGFPCFAAGLGAFLLGHVCYLVILINGLGALKGWKELLCILVPLAVSGTLPGLFNLHGAMAAAIGIYAFTLMYVVSAGVIRVIRGQKWAWKVIAGGVLFLISDSFIALSSFAGIDFGLRHALTMGTYLPAEFLLVSAMVCGILRNQSRSEID